MQYQRTDGSALPDAGTLQDFLIAHEVVIGDGGVSVGVLNDENGDVIGWRADIDALESAVTTAMASWSEPEVREDVQGQFADAVTALFAIDAESRTPEQTAVLAMAQRLGWT